MNTQDRSLLDEAIREFRTRNNLPSVSTSTEITKGGPGSGNFGHAGRPGEVGGSSSEGGSIASSILAQGGFTYNPDSHKSPKRGYVVAMPRELGMERPYTVAEFKANAKEIIKAYITELRDKDKAGDFDKFTDQPYFGGWVDDQTDRVVLDVVQVYSTDSRAEAINVGRERQQDGIYWIGHGTIDLRDPAAKSVHSDANLEGRHRRRFGRESRSDSQGDGLLILNQAYDESQHPRDDHGRWTDGGGVSGGTGLDTEPERSQYWEDKIKAGVGIESVFVENSSITNQAALTTLQVLTEMKDKGYKMPERLFVQLDWRSAPHGHTDAFVLPSGVGLGNELHLEFPLAIRALDPNLDNLMHLTFSGTAEFDISISRFAVDNGRDMVLHEMGHVQKGVMTGGLGGVPEDFTAAVQHFTGDRSHGAIEAESEARDRVQRAAYSVSRYAYKSPHEFLAESFVRQYRGEKLTPDAQEMYKLFGGVKIL